MSLEMDTDLFDAKKLQLGFRDRDEQLAAVLHQCRTEFATFIGASGVAMSRRPIFEATHPRPSVMRTERHSASSRVYDKSWIRSNNTAARRATVVRPHSCGISRLYLTACAMTSSGGVGTSGCGHSEAAADATLRRCPACNMKLWPSAQVRPLRFHHLRHSTASLLMMAGANPAAVQRILRHSDPRITTEVYGHLAPGYLKAEVDRLSFGPALPERQPAVVVAATSSAPFATPLLRPSSGASSGGMRTNPKTGASQRVELVGVTGFEPAASWSQTRRATRLRYTPRAAANG